MDAGVVRKFRMEGCGHGSSLPHDDGIGAFSGQDFYALTDMFDLRRSDKHHFDRAFLVLTFGIGQELSLADGTVDLAPVGVAAYADVERTETMLPWIFDFARKQNCPGAGAERGPPADKLLQPFETLCAQQLQKRP